MFKRAWNILIICMVAAKHIYDEGYTYIASALAFTTLLSLVPMITVFVYILTQFPILEKFNYSAKLYISETFIPSSIGDVVNELNIFIQQASQMPILGIMFLFITAIMLIITIDNAIYAIWERRGRKTWIQYFLIYPLIVILLPFLIILEAMLNTSMIFIFQTTPFLHFVSFIIPLCINMIMLTVLYFVTAHKKIKWHEAILGGFIAALLLELAKMSFTFFAQQFTNYEYIYGALSIIPFFLIWLYIFWLIVLYGAFIVKIKYQSVRAKADI